MNPVPLWSVTSGFLMLALLPGLAVAQQPGRLTGAVIDTHGGRVAAAIVTLVGGPETGEATTGSDGTYLFENLSPGRYEVVVSAAGFEPYTSESIYVAPAGRAVLDVTLQIGAVRQEVVVTAAAGAILQTQTGAPVTVIDEATLQALNIVEVSEALRLVPGSHLVPTGARGGTTAMFIRGGNANFNKVLVDGIPANDIGGAFDFAGIATAGVERVEVLRQTNSVMYGSDALAGVIEITTRRGRTRTPEVEYSLDGGNLGTLSTSLSGGGAVQRVDYFSTYSRFMTDNHLQNNRFENGTYAGRFGVAAGGGTDVSVSLRRINGEYESANAFSLFQVADDSSQAKDQTYVTVAARSQWTDRWQSTARFGWMDEEFRFVNPAPSGMPFDPFGFGANYLGNRVTVTGANGFSVTGRGILDFAGTYPSTFDRRTGRQVVAGDTTIQLHDALSLSGGARFEHEQGFDDPDADPTATRNNGGVFVEGRGSFLNRHYVNAGLGYERNEVFESAVTPRVSVASYVRLPSASRLSDTKLTLNAGTGIKAPSVFQEENSLFALVRGTPASASVSPVGPERSRSFDVGVEQGLWGGDARARVAYFHNTFDDLLEFLGRTQLTRAGVPADVAAATRFGAYLNAASYRARGLEASGEAAVGRMLRINASYTFLDAEVTEAFSASASFNPAFPGVSIGAFSPLVGERPFRRPTHSGTVMVMYAQGPAQVTLSGFFSGKRDDSTFMSDEFFGSSMLLPNQDLAAAYQKFDLSGAYQVHPRLRAYVSIENLLDEPYEPSFGFPGLPLTARVGFHVSFGGDRPRRP